MTPWVLRAERAQRAAPWVRDRRRIRALKGQVLPFAMILLRDRQFFLLPFQGAVTWVVRKPRVPFTSPPARFILPWAKFLLPLPGRSPPIAFPCGLFLRQLTNEAWAMRTQLLPYNRRQTESNIKLWSSESRSQATPSREQYQTCLNIAEARRSKAVAMLA